MKIIEGIKHKGRPFEIPDCGRDDLPEFFKEMGYKAGAEIGVYKGHFTKKLCQAGLKMYGIDPWTPYPGFDKMQYYRIERHKVLYKKALRNLSGFDVTLIKKKSMDALGDFKDGNLDFVYIDANHKLKYATEDICEWSKKVRKGGVVSGHDYIHPTRLRVRSGAMDKLHVKFAVDAYVEAYRIKNWYLLGEKQQKPGEKRDRYRSWMWIK